jgi:hypothetical protein
VGEDAVRVRVDERAGERGGDEGDETMRGEGWDVWRAIGVGNE